MLALATVLCVTNDAALATQMRHALDTPLLRVEIHQADEGTVVPLIQTITPDVMLIDLRAIRTSPGLLRATVRAHADHPVVFVSGPQIPAYAGAGVGALLGTPPWTFARLLERIRAQSSAVAAAQTPHGGAGAA